MMCEVGLFGQDNPNLPISVAAGSQEDLHATACVVDDDGTNVVASGTFAASTATQGIPITLTLLGSNGQEITSDVTAASGPEGATWSVQDTLDDGVGGLLGAPMTCVVGVY